MADTRKAGRFRRFLKILGPGLITGAADDDPSGIVAYTQAGAAYQYSFLWIAILQVPLMIAMQTMSARIGLVSGRDLAGALREHYPRWVLWLSAGLLLVANSVSIAADLDGITAGLELLTGVSSIWFILPVVAFILGMLAFSSYASIARAFKWLTLSLLAYVAAGVLAGPDWSRILRATLLPQISWSRDYLVVFVGLFGTSITPYLFFWQSAQEMEKQKDEGRQAAADRRGASRKEIRDVSIDTGIGMVFSQIICYFTIIAAGATIYTAGQHNIDTPLQAAQALSPIGKGTGTVLFCLGLIGTGLLGVPTLAASSAYAINGVMNWQVGLGSPVLKARAFYGIIGISLLIGAALDLVGISPVTLLFGAAVVNGLLAPPLMAVVLLLSNSREVMKGHANGRLLNVLGIAALAIMTITALWLTISWLLSILPV
ncbi:MAG: NRAMP family divalent metal transporter [Solirubrobacterales bacterium]